MDNTINGRTPEEIKKGLECSHTKHCIFKSCPYYAQDEESSACIDQSRADALFLINQLQEDKKQLERERDAAVEQLKQADKENLLECTHCKHNVRCSEILLGCNDCDNSECPCSTCVDLSNWQWRGVQEVE